MTLINLLIQLAPLVVQIVQAIEKAAPQTPGVQKLDAAVKVVQGVVAAVPEASEHVEAMKEHAVPLINTAVAVLNAAGIFRSSGDDSRGG